MEGALDIDLALLADHTVLPNIAGAIALAKPYQLPLLFSGGIGHSTALLAEMIARHPLYRQIETCDKSDAELLGKMAHVFAALADNPLLLETALCSCGENAAFNHR